MVNKRKILNDPVYGFITIPDEFIFDLINQPLFQRLNRIRQLGLTYMVYPGAHHTRFHHAIGAMHLMDEAISVLLQKGIAIDEKERQAALVAILLHDIGHGPFSHALEHSLIHGVNHEDLSLRLMKMQEEKYGEIMKMSIDIFQNTYSKKFLHQLVSGQLDVDRLDYLMRDSFFTGVSEGIIGTERILKMMCVNNGDLAVEEKGIYSIEKFIMARRLMYWQVYLHKTVVSAESMMISTLKRAQELALSGEKLFASPALAYFLENNVEKTDLNDEVMSKFLLLDDSDILTSIKVWQNHDDRILSQLASGLVNRKLFRTRLSSEKSILDEKQNILLNIQAAFQISEKEAKYFIASGSIENNTYNPDLEKIWISMKDHSRKNITEASDQLDHYTLSKVIKKYYISYPKAVQL
ncbi:MAG: HD domain-containing protein [Bacteroidales bacterium]|nr:HD domain-containing protein [Bacteroidales bacterium]